MPKHLDLFFGCTSDESVNCKDKYQMFSKNVRVPAVILILFPCDLFTAAEERQLGSQNNYLIT